MISPFVIGIISYGIKRKSDSIGKAILTISAVIIGFIFLISITSILTKKKILEKSDYYGEYTIDRNYFSGEQADWQYNNFRFEIKENDSIYFYKTKEKKILKTYKGKISTLKGYSSERITIRMNMPTHHVLDSNPTIYREAWGFFLVFNSPKFNNMYFRKGKWKKIN